MFAERTYQVSGIVQGVGFRPMCVRIAHRCGICGSVANTSDGVILRLQGKESDIDRYLDELRSDCPDVALIIEIELIGSKEITATDTDFVIEKSVRSERQRVLLPPDMATCPDCLADMRDPKNRRYRYPFTNCTNCGPRFSIVRSLPYDRPATTMAIFPMCDDCAGEYTCETDRRFHAQPNACPDCGPHLSYTDASANLLAEREDALSLACRDILAGKILAVKGLGGFHLVCDARNEQAVALLRTRKHRPRRPFAIMIRDIAELQRYVCISAEEEKLITGARAPILLLEKNDATDLAPSLAPGLKRLGVMLPYTPLHHLIMDEISPLVMTSANLSGDPLVSDNDEALLRLAGICDSFLMHDRPIHMKIDDSVLLPDGGNTTIIRRARGYVPNPIITGQELAPVIAAGAEMKSTFAFSQDTMIFPSQYLGDMKDLHSGEFYGTALNHFASLYNFAPKYLVHDLHPMFLSTSIARKSWPHLPTLAVQHHYAHMMACLAENRHRDPAIGLIMDGTGYGDDGTVWGGEILLGSTKNYERAGHLKSFRLPGGDRAVTEIWRCGFSLLVETFGAEKALAYCERYWPGHEKAAEQLLKAWNAFPLCTSCGRLFDGIAAIAGRRQTVTYDGEAAMELEAASERNIDPTGLIEYDKTSGRITWQPLVSSLVKNDIPTAEAGGRLHAELASALVHCAAEVARGAEIRHVALSGGCWQNALLLRHALPSLRSHGLTPLTHKLLSPNDECISVGQAYVAGLRFRDDR